MWAINFKNALHKKQVTFKQRGFVQFSNEIASRPPKSLDTQNTLHTATRSFQVVFIHELNSRSAREWKMRCNFFKPQNVIYVNIFTTRSALHSTRLSVMRHFCYKLCGLFFSRQLWHFYIYFNHRIIHYPDYYLLL